MSSSSIQVKKLPTSEHKAWDDYVNKHAEGTFFHLSGWKTVLENSFSFPCHYLVAKTDEKIAGVLPLTEQKSMLFGHALISNPFCVYGGVLADSDEIKHQLEEAASKLAEQLNVDYLELRYKTKQKNQLIEKSAHSYFIKPLADNDEENLLAIKKKQRAVVRHSLKNELVTDVNKNIDDFYQIYSTSVRNLGTPVFSKKYMKNLVDAFGDKVDILSVKKDGKTISSVMNFYYKNEVLPYYGGGLFEARALKSNDHMYYKLMCHATEKGCTSFDFGRSKNDSGAYKYKRTWGIEPQPLYHYYHLVKANDIPNLSPNNPKYQMFIKLWQKLPLKISQLIGPHLSKYLG